MFTLDQIHAAHSKVKSGADFPAYIQDLKQIGVRRYETFVSDGHTHYVGDADFSIDSASKYGTLEVATDSNATAFISALKAHQHGQTDYPTFCKDCARTGIVKWEVALSQMTCTYFDGAGNEILQEAIPG